MRSKKVGRRKASDDFEKNAKFLETIVRLRGARPFIPRGVYRFKTHEEAQKWSLEMMARPQKKKAGPRS